MLVEGFIHTFMVINNVNAQEWTNPRKRDGQKVDYWGSNNGKDAKVES